MAGTRIAVIDDWQNAAKDVADWSGLQSRAEVVFFQRHYPAEDEDAAVRDLKDFDIILILRERSRFSETLIARLPRLKMMSLTGSRAPRGNVAGFVACGSAPDSGRRRRHARRPFPGGHKNGNQSGRAHARSCRAWAHRRLYGALRQSTRHAGDRLEPEPHGRKSEGSRRRAREQGTSLLGGGRRQRASGAWATFAWADRRRRFRTHEKGRDLRQHVARTDRR